MRIQKITLEQVLRARDRRADIQNEMLGRLSGREAASGCLVCLTMNIAGEIKRTPMTRALFLRGISELEASGPDIIERRIIDEPSGSEAFWLLPEDAPRMKSRLEAVEDSFPAARLFDFDVLTRARPPEEGKIPDAAQTVTKLSRASARKCLICGRPAAECARSRAHGLDAVRAATSSLLSGFCADSLADEACGSLLDELYTTPKPGLVDLANCGAHTDMDVPLFEKSAECLRPYFRDAVMLGMNGCGMKELRDRGLEAEREMFRVTSGVNTHKGIIYSMGLMLAGMGRVLAEAESLPDGSEDDSFDVTEAQAREYAAELAKQDAEERLAASAASPETNGGKVLSVYGAEGAVREAASGFPHAAYCASRLRYYTERAENTEKVMETVPDDGHAVSRRAGVLAFCDCMAGLEDTNLLHRGGKEGLDFARNEAARIGSLPDFDERISELARLDKLMTERNLSPGGSADMLALAYLTERWRFLFKD